jgi:hypothetical protein
LAGLLEPYQGLGQAGRSRAPAAHGAKTSGVERRRQLAPGPGPNTRPRAGDHRLPQPAGGAGLGQRPGLAAGFASRRRVGNTSRRQALHHRARPANGRAVQTPGYPL